MMSGANRTKVEEEHEKNGRTQHGKATNTNNGSRNLLKIETYVNKD